MARETRHVHSLCPKLPNNTEHSNDFAPPKIITTNDKNDEPSTNVHGYIACFSENNVVEINLRFPKCKCPRSEISKTNDDETDNVTNNEEIKTKIINFDRNNLCDIVNNLDIKTCTKCSISLDVKRLLTRIFSNPALNNNETTMNYGSCRSFMGDGASLLSNPISPRFSESNVSATTDHDDFIIFNLNKQQQRKRSSATQHDDEKSLKEVYFITDEFKKKCTDHHIVVKQNMTKKTRTFSRSMENLLTPEVVRRDSSGNEHNKLKIENGTNTTIANNKESNGKISKMKNRSKSVDDINTSSNEVLEGVESIELIFISDEFLNNAVQKKTEVIIVDDPSKQTSPRPIPSPNSQSVGEDKFLANNKFIKKSVSKICNSAKEKKLYVITDNFKKRSLNNTVIVVKQSDKKKNMVTKNDQNPKHVDESLVLNLKTTTTTNSNTFLTYEEPFSPIYDLEDKEIP